MEIEKNIEKNDLTPKNTSKESNSSVLPPLYGIKKFISCSPKRKIITLKLPKVELASQDSHFVGFHHSPAVRSEHNRVLSMSVECTKSAVPNHLHQSPIKSSMSNYQPLTNNRILVGKLKKHSNLQIKQKKLLKPQKNPNLLKKFYRDTQETPDFVVKNELKCAQTQFTQVLPADGSLYSVAKQFCEGVEMKYEHLFEEIDLNRSGFIVLDDVINYFIFKGLVNPGDGEISYLIIKKRAQDIFQVFCSVALKTRVYKKEFFAVFSVLEQVKEGKETAELMDVHSFDLIQKRIEELKGVFECYAKDGVINKKELKSILFCVHVDDIYMIENLLFSEIITFSRFLRYLPLFLWMHQEVVKQLDILSKTVYHNPIA